jgi:DNA-binding IclR family transcriptional regulator
MRSAEWNEPADSVLGRTMAMLEAFSPEDDGITLSELARRVDLPKATVHRHLQQLCHHKLLERVGDRYQLGMRLFELGQRQPKTRDLRSVVPILGDLRDATHETVHLAVLDSGEVLYLEKLVGHGGPPLASRVGGRLPAHCTGLGKALLAFSPKGVVDGVLRGPLSRMTPRTIILPGLLIRELAKIRKEGVAFEHEESTMGVMCVACPVMGSDGHAVAAISIAGWAHHFDPHRVASAVRTAALAVSRQLAETESYKVRLPRDGSPSRLRFKAAPAASKSHRVSESCSAQSADIPVEGC